MTEKEIKLEFVNHLDQFKKLMKLDYNLRLYAMELPVFAADGTKYADVVLEIEKYENTMMNQLIVMEFKKGFIDLGVVEQCERYARTIKRQLYRKPDMIKVIVAEGFSHFELNMCKEHDFIALRYDPQTNYMELS